MRLKFTRASRSVNPIREEIILLMSHLSEYLAQSAPITQIPVEVGNHRESPLFFYFFFFFFSRSDEKREMIHSSFIVVESSPVSAIKNWRKSRDAIQSAVSVCDVLNIEIGGTTMRCNLNDTYRPYFRAKEQLIGTVPTTNDEC